MRRNEKFNDYDGFVEKFKPKKTTDDCITPPEIYDVVKDYVCKRWGVNPDNVVRPFWPGGDFETFDYPEGAVVIDNPPFSILSKIKRFYLDRGIPFFLFAPSLTLFSSFIEGINNIVCDCNITYENGANVKTSFVTTFGANNVLETCPELTDLVNKKMKEILRAGKNELPKYIYPDNVVTSALAQKYARYGRRFNVPASEAVFIRSLDSQKGTGKGIFGGGLLVSEKVAAEKAAVEKEYASEKAKAENEYALKKVGVMWSLSDREKDIIAALSAGA